MAFDVKSVCIFVLLLIAFQQVVAKDCSEIESIRDCSQCSACGGHWCAKPTDMQSGKGHCSRTWTEGWCDDNLTPKGVFLEVTGSSVNPTKLGDQSITVGVPHRIPYTPSYKINVTAETQYDLKTRTHCKNNNCYIEVLAGQDFCEQGAQKFVDTKIDIEGVTEPVMVTYHVSCSCHCSAEVHENSGFCNNHGNYSCGVCACNNKWVGEYCNHYCEDERGDGSLDPCTNEAKDNVKCSGNGICGPCQQCQCFSEGIGAQYYQPELQCLDLCSNVNYHYELCLGQTEFGSCNQTNTGVYPLNIQPCNSTLITQRDDQNRSIWISCEGKTVNNIIVDYYAMMTGNEIYIMTGACGENNAGRVAAGGTVKVPVIVCLVLAAAAAAAAAGYMVWKQRTPRPNCSARLDNFDAENCTGRNPLYRPPTSIFKNPIYGKL